MPPVPEQIGKYKVVGRVASGGMGDVFKAEHPTLDRHIIIKKLTLRGSSSARERFRREAEIMMDFASDYIVGVYDHFKEKASHYIVLEYVDGMSLEGLIKRDRYLPETLALLIFADCCKALQYAHDRGVVHRDIKPANILISKDGKVKLVDFGIASIRTDEDEGLTREGMTLGTPSYMSPEQYQDSRAVDNRSDIYALGVMLYEMTTGKKPFPGTMSPEAMRLIQQGKYLRPDKINPKISKHSRFLIKKSMKVKPARRFRSMEDALKSALEQTGRSKASAERSLISSYLAGGEIQTPRRKRWPALTVVGVSLFLLLASSAVFAWIRGYHHEVFDRGEYGALAISVRIPKASGAPEEQAISALIFSQDEESPPVIAAGDIDFRADSRQETADYYAFVSNRIYLPSGAYRVDLSRGSNLQIESLYLSPLATRKTSRISVDIPPLAATEVMLGFTATDISTGERINDGIEMLVKANGAWRSTSDSALVPGRRPVQIKTGATYSFRFLAPGYYPEEYEVAIGPGRSSVHLRPSLSPIPGAMVITTQIEGVTLLIDGAETYQRGGYRMHTEKIPKTTEGSTEIILPPGSYSVSVAGKAALDQVLRVSVRGGRRKIIYINTNDDGGLDLRPGPESADSSVGRQ